MMMILNFNIGGLLNLDDDEKLHLFSGYLSSSNNFLPLQGGSFLHIAVGCGRIFTLWHLLFPSSSYCKRICASLLSYFLARLPTTYLALYHGIAIRME